MPRGTPQTKASEKRPAARKGEKVRTEEKESAEKCGECPIAKAFGLCGSMCSLLGNMDINDFFVHMATARREVMLGLRSLLDEAIRMEEERIDRRQSEAERKGRGKEQLREITIE
jgi:hypothetical protein